MQENGKKITLRSILTICAEVATIISCILAVYIFRTAQSETEAATSIKPVIILFSIVNIIMFITLSSAIGIVIYRKINGKAYKMAKKMDAFINSNSKYLFDLQAGNAQSKANLINKSKQAIKGLAQNKLFDEDVYYMILYSLFYSPEGNINVVSILDDNEWVQTPEEDEFLRVNLALAEKKVHLNRIFVVEESEVKEKLNNKSIQSFIEADHTYIHLFVVFKNKLSRGMLGNIAGGFIEFYNFVAACDIFQDQEIRGTIKYDKKEVELYNKIYMQLTQYYMPLNDDFKHKYFV